MKQRRSAAMTAKLLLLNAKLYERERDREITRYRFSLQTLRKVSGRRSIRETFLDALDEELEELGWMFLRLGTEFAVMDLAKTETWVKLSGKRLLDSGHLTLSEESVERVFEEHFPTKEDLDELQEG